MLADLKRKLRYHPGTGAFTWLVSNKGGKGIGSVAGSRTGAGYIEIGVSGKRYLAHRLAVLFATGSLPKHQVDHINGDRADNRIANLREATGSENKQNIKTPRRHNKSGYLGVSFSQPMKKFEARIRINNVVHRLGYFDEPKDAHAAYLQAKRQMHNFCTI